MPTYEYECERCSRTFEARQRISDAPLTACPHCAGSVHRLLAAAPFILKGKGWYVTDYPSETRKKGVAEEKKSDAPAPAPSSSEAAAPPSSPSTPPSSTS